MDIATEYINSCIKIFESYKKMGDAVIERLSEEQLHYTANESCNSIAVLVKHISGNMLSRFTNFLTEDGEKEWRNRDGEFVDTLKTKTKISEAWEKGWACLFFALKNISEEQIINKKVTIRQEPHSVVAAVNRQLAHYSDHIGQMVYVAKILKKDAWKSLSIPKGKSKEWNQKHH